MKFLSFLAGNSVEKIGDAVDKIFTSDEERLEAKIIMEKMRTGLLQNQHEINLSESKHRSVFVAGWRPAIGWICAIGLANAFLITPLMIALGFPTVTLPMDQMMTLVVALLGLGGYRTIEKISGKTV